MKIGIGSKSEDKLSIASRVIKKRMPDAVILPFEVQSNIVDQPMSKEVTISGAVNRAKNCYLQDSTLDLSIGLEGGLEHIKGLLHLICIVAIYDGTETYIGESEVVMLPFRVSEEVKNGAEFGQSIREHAKRNDNEEVRQLIYREKAFTQALDSAFAQMRNPLK